VTPGLRVLVSGPAVDATPTGAAVHLREMLRAALQQAPDLSVVLRGAGRHAASAVAASAARIDPRVQVSTTPVPARVLRPMQARLRQPSERLLAGRYDVFHQFHADADPAVPGDKLVVTLQDTVALTWPDDEGRMYPGVGRLLARAAAVVTVSEFSKSQIASAFPVDPDKIHVIANGVDHARFRPDRVPNPATRPDEPFLLYTGGRTPRKNVARIIEALAHVRRADPLSRLRLVLAGPVAAAEAGLRAGAPSDLDPKALDFTGFVDDETLADLYVAAEALIFPSLYEGFGLPILEAMATGTAVITSDGNACAEVAGDAAILVDPTSTAAIAAAISDVSSAPEAVRTSRRRRGISRAATFRWERSARELVELYGRIAAR
jgi:glycosyltransferase involved in cell wall biosynthesis